MKLSLLALALSVTMLCQAAEQPPLKKIHTDDESAAKILSKFEYASTEQLIKLVEQYPALRSTSLDTNTPLITQCITGKPQDRPFIEKTIQALLAAKVSIDQMDYRGRTALRHACEYDYDRHSNSCVAVRTLLSHNADITLQSPNDGLDPLAAALISSNHKTALILTKHPTMPKIVNRPFATRKGLQTYLSNIIKCRTLPVQRNAIIKNLIQAGATICENDVIADLNSQGEYSVAASLCPLETLEIVHKLLPADSPLLKDLNTIIRKKNIRTGAPVAPAEILAKLRGLEWNEWSPYYPLETLIAARPTVMIYQGKHYPSLTQIRHLRHPSSELAKLDATIHDKRMYAELTKSLPTELSKQVLFKKQPLKIIRNYARES